MRFNDSTKLCIRQLQGPLPGLNLEGIDCLIVGVRIPAQGAPMNPDWVSKIRDQCQDARFPFFFK